MKNCCEKDRGYRGEGFERRMLKKVFGVLLFVLAIFFREIFVKLPGNTGLLLALGYFLLQYWLFVVDGGDKNKSVKNR